MDRGSDGKLQEVGQVSVSLQRASGDFQTTKLNGFEVFARFGSAIAPLGDLDQDGFNGKVNVKQLCIPYFLCSQGKKS
jgi:intercellular adhesion molecule 4